ncbi:MAG TPA: porin family protein [Puia sp.]|nr:porin family protein [Puia sp.]
MGPMIFFIIAVGFSNRAVSQNLQFGITGGAGISGITKTNNIGVAFEQRNAVLDYFAGVTSNIKINNDFAFRPELYFEKKGWTNTYNNLIINLTANAPYFSIQDSILHADKVSMNYIKLPLNISFSLPQIADGKIDVEAGPYIAYAISGNYHSFYGNSNTSVYNFTGNIRNDNSALTGVRFNRFDYGLDFKMGYELSLGILIQARYELGLRDAVTNELISGPSATKFRSAVIGLSYLFSKK